MKKLLIGVALAAFTLSAAPSAVEAKTMVGMASYYKHGRLTANGEHFNPMGLTCAHRSMPFGTKLRVTNLKNGKSVVVRVNDRGPFIRGRILDLSLGAAKMVGLTGSGVGRVKVEVIG